MKRSLLAATLWLGMAAIANADPLLGTWQTAKDDNGNFGHIEVTQCGDAFCGVLVRTFNDSGAEYKSQNLGKQMIWDMKAKGNGKYAGGKVWSPDRDKTYASRMVMTGNQVTVKGCVLVVCRDGGTWTKVN